MTERAGHRNRHLTVGIHPDRIGQESYSDRWAEFLMARGVEVRILNLLADDALEQASRCDGVMWRWAHTPQAKQSAQRILYAIEHYLHIPVYPDTWTAWHYDEKIAQFYLLRALGAPMPQTWLFWKRDEAIRWAQTAPYPVLFKLSPGASSTNVIQVQGEREAVSLINRMFGRGAFASDIKGAEPHDTAPPPGRTLLQRVKDSVQYILANDYPPLPFLWWKPEKGYAYFQEFLPGNDFDTRITVIGNRAFGRRRFNRTGDFRASGSGRYDFTPGPIDKRCVELAFDMSRCGKFQSMSYDILFKDGQPVITEISYTNVDRAVYDCLGYWNDRLEWVEGHMWPEQAQVEDFITRISNNLKD